MQNTQECWITLKVSFAFELQSCELEDRNEYSPAIALSHRLQYEEPTEMADRWLSRRCIAYMAGTAKELNSFAIKVGGFYDHVHLLLRIPAKTAVAELVGKLKANTSKHINETSGIIRKFGWQDGYGAFTVSMSAKNRVVKYIEN